MFDAGLAISCKVLQACLIFFIFMNHLWLPMSISHCTLVSPANTNLHCNKQTNTQVVGKGLRARTAVERKRRSQQGVDRWLATKKTLLSRAPNSSCENKQPPVSLLRTLLLYYDLPETCWNSQSYPPPPVNNSLISSSLQTCQHSSLLANCTPQDCETKPGALPGAAGRWWSLSGWWAQSGTRVRPSAF